MDKLRDAVGYICEKYPHKNELSKARLTKMIYLADWRSAITRNEQITSIRWIFNHYGPYVEDVVNTARNDPSFEIVLTETIRGNIKELLRYQGHTNFPSLSKDDKEILDFVIETTKSHYWDQFIRLVYSTYPVLSSRRSSELDLTALAKEYLTNDENRPQG